MKVNPWSKRRERWLTEEVVETAVLGRIGRGTLVRLPMVEHPGSGVERAPNPGRVSPVRNVAEVSSIRKEPFRWGLSQPVRDWPSKPIARGA